jgi:hypothetical protein
VYYSHRRGLYTSHHPVVSAHVICLRSSSLPLVTGCPEEPGNLKQYRNTLDLLAMTLIYSKEESLNQCSIPSVSTTNPNTFPSSRYTPRMQVPCLSIHKFHPFADQVTAAQLWLALLIGISACCTVVPASDLPSVETAIVRSVMLATLCLLAEDVVRRLGSTRERGRGGCICCPG